MTINKINHARLSFGFAVRFAVHFLPMACYCWLVGVVVFSFWRVRTDPKTSFLWTQRIITVFLWTRKIPPLLTICAMRSPVVLVVCLA